MTTPFTEPAVFLDRDGTIIEDRGYLRHPKEISFFPETLQSLARLQHSFVLFIVTNQSGVAEGRISLLEVKSVNDYILAHLKKNGIAIRDVYVCPHQRSDNCRCMKPNPYFLLLAAHQYGISLPHSFVIGDHPHDVKFAQNGGATGIYVLSGHGRKHQSELQPDVCIANDIAQAVSMILSQTETDKARRQ